MSGHHLDEVSSTVGCETNQPDAPLLARGTCVGRYIIVERLGTGGMGIVYKAFDPELGRPIALKLLRSSDADTVVFRDRMLREAQALAQLSHPNVVAVHDVGTLGDDVYIAMEFIEGRTVRQWLHEAQRTRSEVLEVFLAAGEGLAAAHRARIIHRDFKPDNVIVGNDGRVRVLDFGLARVVGSQGDERTTAASPAPLPAAPTPQVIDGDRPGEAASQSPAPLAEASSAASSASHYRLASPLTQAGSVMGTPKFMAPEQHRGEPTEATADQFSFCVSLYDALYDTFPFTAKQDVLAGRISNPPVATKVPHWLREVLVRGLSTKPEDRFASMEALLAALRADPQVARRRRVRAALVVGLALTLLGAIGVGIYAYRARRAVAEEARIAQLFGHEVERISALARQAAWLPLHDTRAEYDAIGVRLPELEQEMRRLGAAAQRPGHEALGRGYLVLERYDDALRELEIAYRAGYHSPELSYALGLVYGKRYQRGLEELQKSGDDKVDALRRAQLEHAYRDPALRFLKEARTGDGLQLAGVDAPEYVEGLIALYEQRLADALALAEKAAEHPLWRCEARTLVGDIHRAAGRERLEHGDRAGARDELARAGLAYRAAADMARSSLPALAGECHRLVDLAEVDVDQGISPEASLQNAMVACSNALVARPDNVDVLAAEAYAWELLAYYQSWHSIDPTPAFQRSVALGQRALQIDPREVRACESLAQAHWIMGRYSLFNGHDPGQLLDQSIVYGKRALELEPMALESLRLISRAYWSKGEDEEGRGIDPRPSYRQAIEYARKGTQRFGSALLWNTLGSSYASLSHWEMNHGVDPLASLQQAIDAHERATVLNPNDDTSLVNFCDDNEAFGIHLMRLGQDPQAKLDRAVAACRRAIELNNHNSFAYLNLAATEADAARHRLRHDADPTAALERARTAIKRALAIDARPLMHFLVGTIELLQGRWEMRRAQDPSRPLALADAALRHAIALSDGKDALPLRELAELDLTRAEWRARHEQAIDVPLREGLELTERAIAVNSMMAEAYGTRAELNLLAARTAHDATDRAAAASRARAAIDRALAINSFLGDQYLPLAAQATRLAER